MNEQSQLVGNVERLRLHGAARQRQSSRTGVAGGAGAVLFEDTDLAVGRLESNRVDPCRIRGANYALIPPWRRVAPVVDYSEALGRVKTTLRRCAVLTRPARFQQAAITGATGSMSRSSGRTVFLAVARFVAGSRDLLWRQPDDSAFAPHSDRIAVSF